ncbi:MAG TPA: hypothetical protein VJZ71_18400 [Phycisphaerae bacterium]|nr:hypothetical protein [Phycisphaerae bacterium]
MNGEQGRGREECPKTGLGLEDNNAVGVGSVGWGRLGRNRLKIRAAYGLTERPRESHWIDPALIAEYDLSPNAPDEQLSPDQLRCRDLRRALIAFGVFPETRRGGNPDSPPPTPRSGPAMSGSTWRSCPNGALSLAQGLPRAPGLP